jgi:hypothetical protein
MKFDFLTEVKISIVIVTPCFVVLSKFHREDEGDTFLRNMVTIYKTTQCHNPEDLDPQKYFFFQTTRRVPRERLVTLRLK